MGERGRVRPFGQTPRATQRRQQGGSESDAGSEETPRESRTRRVSHTRRPRADGDRPQPPYLREDTRRQPQALRPEKAKKRNQGEEGDAVPVRKEARDLERGHPLH